MHLLRVSQMYISDLRMEFVGHCAMSSQGNSITMVTSSNDELTFELIYEANGSETMPFLVSYVKVPQERPLTKLTQPIQLHAIYENATNILEAQELSLEPVYIHDCSIDPIEPKLLQSSIAVNKLKTGEQLLAVLNTYGSCTILKKTSNSNRWEHQVCDISSFLIDNVLPVTTNLNSIKTYSEFKEVIDKRWITFIAWDLYESEHILYVGTAMNEIVGIKYNEDSMELDVYCHITTDMGRHSYIKIYANMLLVSNVYGIVHLYKINRTGTATIEKITNLWPNADNMAVNVAEMIFCEKLNAYIILLCKGAHVLGYLISDKNLVLCKKRIHISGIKVTGVLALNAYDYLITTLIGTVCRIKITVNLDTNDMQLQLKTVYIDNDANNFQILGLATTRYHNLFTMLLYRNKEYSTLSKKQKLSTILATYSTRSVKTLEKLKSFDIKFMNEYVDFITKIRLDLLNNNSNASKYLEFSNTLNQTNAIAFNDDNLKLFQIKHIILKAVSQYEDIKYKSVRKQTALELTLSVYCIETIHILCRLNELAKAQVLTEFQQLSASCMIKKFNMLNDQRPKVPADESQVLSNFINEFTSAANTELANVSSCINLYNVNEKCLICDEIIGDAMICSKIHKLRRCCVSSIQLPYFNERFCIGCDVAASSNDQELLQLFSHDEVVKCTFCRFLFVSYEL